MYTFKYLTCLSLFKANDSVCMKAPCIYLI